LDDSSREAVMFAGRRLRADGIALLFAAREHAEGHGLDLRLPRLWLSGLARADADELCRTLIPDAVGRVRTQLYEATGGNPLGMIELAEAWQADLLDGMTNAPLVPAGSRIER